MNHRQKLILTFQNKIEQGEFLVAAGVDSLSQVKCCQDVNCDLILLYPVSKNRTSQNPFLAGYLAFGNTNDLMLQTASEIMPIINSKNVLAGLNGSDPFKIDSLLLKQIQQHHFAGIHNYPAMSLVDGKFGTNIDYLNLGIDKEIKLMRTALHNDLFTCAMIQTKKQVHAMLKNNVDMLIFYIGLGEHGTLPSPRKKQQRIHQLQELTHTAKTMNPQIPLLFFDETITTIDEIQLMSREVPDIDGYCLLPVTNSVYSEKRLSLEIKQLKALSRNINR